MQARYVLIAILLAAAIPDHTVAQTLWDRRDPYSAYLFHDLRARNVGDVLTIVIDETTGSDAQEKREMDKKTSSTASASSKGSSSSLGTVLRSFAADFDFSTASERSFDGKANTTINRNFNDRLSVVVVAVMPNGNIVVEGYRQRMIARELRTLRVAGVVRPADIGPFNTVQSQYIANLQINYSGRGPESSYTNQGWGGRIFNKLWPF